MIRSYQLQTEMFELEEVVMVFGLTLEGEFVRWNWELNKVNFHSMSSTESYKSYYGNINDISTTFYESQIYRCKKYLLPEINKLKKDITELSVLEIGSGPWYFAAFCKNAWIRDFTGLDLDENIVKATSEKFSPYIFLHEDGASFLKKNLNKKFDIIFLSHVFEHFDTEESKEIVSLIYENLAPNGVWINIMPNAASLNSGFLRFHDYTHRMIYDDNSFNQFLRGIDGVNISASHSNIEPVYSQKSHRYIFPILLFFRKLFLLSMGWYYPIYTNEILSFIYKK